MPNAATVWRDYETDGVPSSGDHKVKKSDARAWGKLVEQQTNLSNSPLTYDAVGDGVADDAAEFAEAEAASANIYLADDAVFNLGATRPTKPVYGPGSLKLSGNELGGYQPVFMPDRDNVIIAPDNAAEALVGNVYPPNPENVPSNNYMNVVMSPGSMIGRDGVIAIRSTAVGAYIGQKVIQWNLMDAFGINAMSFTEWGQRNTVIGSDAFPWGGIGSRDKAIEYKHNFYRQGVLPNEAGWDAQYGAPAGTGAAIWAFADYADAQTDFAFNTGIGRDAGANFVRGVNNFFGGYQSAAVVYAGSENTVLGTLAGNQSYFMDEMTIVGGRAAIKVQNASRTLAAGYRAIENALSANRTVALGAFVGGDQCTAANDAVLIGYLAGQDEAADLSNKFILNNVRSNTFKPLMAGDFLTRKAGMNLSPSELLGYWHVRLSAVPGATVLNTADGMVIERNGTTGLTILSSDTGFGQVLFGDSAAANSGGLQYDHATNVMQFRVGGATRVQFSATGLGFNGTTAIAKPTGWGAPTGTATRTTFATGTVTTAQLAERVKALIDDLTSYGLIGA
ncbi:hypothetical protein GOC49_04480 [Sinorhizobium meliloti]|nr:hypothetical protein [Sinorhizobium meliloti]